ncbi:MAG: type II toxin-antitoxin system RelE/ParE family toxin [Conchiformibius sp.]|nr:type II toxin-antitoxin system RelE/ParE family toxin [Conchiformibius sp.]
MKYLVQTTEIFDEWLEKLSDRQAKARIAARLIRAASGNLGNWRSVGGGVSEMKIDVGQGYRLYYTIQGQIVIFMLMGGSKATQQADIARAKQMKQEMEND